MRKCFPSDTRRLHEWQYDDPRVFQYTRAITENNAMRGTAAGAASSTIIAMISRITANETHSPKMNFSEAVRIPVAN